MDSSYFGEPANIGNNNEIIRSGSSSSSSSSSRKGKKSSNSDKPRQPQRGLGVAQLEKIRLHSQMGCSYLPSIHTPPYPTATNLNQHQQEDVRLQVVYSSSTSIPYSSSSSSSSSYGFHQGHHNIMMGLSEFEGANIRYGDSHPSVMPRWNHGNAVVETQNFAHPSMTRHLLNLQEDSLEKKRRSDSMGSSSQNSTSSDTQELDLELRLSL